MLLVDVCILYYISLIVANSGPASLEKNTESDGSLAIGNSPRLNGITVDRSVEFSYEELANATNDFNLSNKIGQGGFGSVFYGELRGEVCSRSLSLHLQNHAY